MNKNYKILQVIDSLEIGGSERMSVNMYNTLTSNSIDNYLVVSRKSGPLFNFIKEKDNVFFLNKKGFFDCIAFLRFFKLIKANQPSIIHAHQTSIYWVFLMKVFFPKLTIIWHDHWGFSDLLKDSDRKLIKYFSFLIHGVVCVNEKIRLWNSKKLKIKSEYITYIPNYPDIEIQKSKKTNKFTLVCVANIRRQKDHTNLLKACALLKKQNIDFELLLAGSLEDVEYVDEIQKLIVELKLNDCVEILGSITNISEVLSKADVGVLSSVSEGLPVSLLEYGLAGLPVVCTDVGQCSEVLGGGKYGWIVPPNSSVALAKAIKESLEDKSKAQLKAKALQNNIQEKYGAQGFFLKYFELLKKVKSTNS